MLKILNSLKKNKSHLLLAVLLVCFIVLDVQLPAELAYYVDTLLGKVGVMIGAFSLFFVHSVLGVLAMVAGFVLLNRSTGFMQGAPNVQYLPSEKTKLNHLDEMNQFPITLEEEVIHDMIPFVSEQHLPPPEFKPTLNSVHDAAKLY